MNKEKYVDESWKEQASEEKDKLAETAAGTTQDQPGTRQGGDAPDSPAPSSEASAKTQEQRQDIEVNFLNYITSLGFQAMIFMGEIPNPVTNEVEQNLPQAKFLIDTLSMLKEKTAGNLNAQESHLLENSIYELQLRYVQLVTKKETSGGEQTA